MAERPASRTRPPQPVEPAPDPTPSLPTETPHVPPMRPQPRPQPRPRFPQPERVRPDRPADHSTLEYLAYLKNCTLRDLEPLTQVEAEAEILALGGVLPIR